MIIGEIAHKIVPIDRGLHGGQVVRPIIPPVELSDQDLGLFPTRTSSCSLEAR